VPANFVPAAAAKRGALALFIVIGRKGSVGGLVSLHVVYDGIEEILIRVGRYCLRLESVVGLENS